MSKMEQTLITADKFYTIANANGKVLEVQNFSTENGAPVQLWAYEGFESQQWSFVKEGQGVYLVE